MEQLRDFQSKMGGIMDKLKEIQSRISKYEEKYFAYSLIAFILLALMFIFLIFGASYLIGLAFFGKELAMYIELGLGAIIMFIIIGMFERYADGVYDKLGPCVNKLDILQRIIRDMDEEYVLMWRYLQDVKITEDNYKELSKILHDIVPIYEGVLSKAIQFDVNKFSEWYLEHVVTLDSFAEDYFSRDNDIIDCIRVQYCDYKSTYLDWGEEFNDFLKKLIGQAHVESKLNEVKIRNLLEDERKLQEKINYYKANSLEYEGM